jgi:hypothetical protein
MAGCKPPIVPYNLTGSTAAPLIPTLDPGGFTPDTTDPGFAKLAADTLGDLASAADGWDSAVQDTEGGITGLEELATAADADLAAILLLLDQQDPAAIGGQIDDFAGAQPQGEQLLGDVTGVSVPALGALALTYPNGSASLTFGGPPETGGVVHAGDPQYELHLQLVPAGPGIHNVTPTGLDGPNPPFGGIDHIGLEAGADGRQYWVAVVLINPAAAGQFTGTVKYDADVTITGISGTAHRTFPFEVVIEA